MNAANVTWKALVDTKLVSAADLERIGAIVDSAAWATAYERSSQVAQCDYGKDAMGSENCWKADKGRDSDPYWSKVTENTNALQKAWTPVDPGKGNAVPNDGHYLPWGNSEKLKYGDLHWVGNNGGWYWADKFCGYGRESENAKALMGDLNRLGVILD